jgi:hypothetical protein
LNTRFFSTLFHLACFPAVIAIPFHHSHQLLSQQKKKSSDRNFSMWSTVVISLVVLFVSLSKADFRCDFEHLSKSILIDDTELEGQSRFSDAYKSQKPIILRGYLTEWSLTTSFLDAYGDLKVQTGSESSIVYSHGTADTLTQLKDFKNITHQHHSESLSFDNDILKKQPQLLDAYGMPDILESVFNHSLASPVLSIGFVQSG